MKKFSKLVLSSLGVMWAGSMVMATPSYSKHFFYVGAIGGYADVDWDSTVAQDNPDDITNLSTPSQAEGQGALFGADIGYQINPYAAVEFEYMRMPKSYIEFDYYDAVFTHAYHEWFSTYSDMNFYALIFKFIAPIRDSNFSFFVDAGPAYQYRTYNRKNWTQTEIIPGVIVPPSSDQFPDKGTWAPAFGGGFLYRMDQHWQGELSFQYAPGTGDSIAFPLTDYIPEVYAGTLKVNYLF